MTINKERVAKLQSGEVVLYTEKEKELYEALEIANKILIERNLYSEFIHKTLEKHKPKNEEKC